jgi:cytochrome bd ubiquinol oxidase subunit I
MTNLLLARWQFGVVTVYHFFFVPMTIGMALLLAIMETIYVITRNDTYKSMTKFWGKLFLINFAVGVVTGILQEFQFGMNWSNYSRFVGDVFGAPLAIESLAAFFLESTFLGVWLFGWDKVSRSVHLASIWLVAIGSNISGFWILTANAFMQRPVGYAIRNGHAEMSSFLALITSRQVWLEFPHVIFGAYATGAFFIAGVSAYQLLRKRGVGIFRRSFKMAVTVGALSSVLTVIVGHEQAQYLMTVQPMKMAASEALWNTSPEHAPWTLFALIDDKKQQNSAQVQIPYALSILAYNRLSGKVEGMNQLQAQYEHKYGPGNYVPPVRTTFWSFRIMVAAGTLMMLFALYGVYLSIKDRLQQNKWFLRLMVPAIALPFIGHTMGWIMTEIGRQPWVVYGLLKTENGVSPTVPASEVLTTLIGQTVVYGILAAIDIYLFLKVIREEPDGKVPDETVVPSL